VLLIFAGAAQFIAGLVAYRRATPLLGNFFCCFGAFAVTAAVAFLMQASGTLPGNAQILSGLLLESFAFIAAGLAVAALSANAVFVAVLALLAIGLCLTGIPNLATATGGGWLIVGDIGGWFMVASAACAYYLGLALIVNSTWKRAALPLGGSAV
jgi:succinate-acetate transporter protein